MSEHVEQTIQMVQQQVQELEQQASDKKKMVNSLCSLIGQPPIYADAAMAPAGGIRPLRADEYYGKGLASAMRMVLDRRESANLGPASVNDIYDALVAGGCKFETKNEENAKRGLYNALAKNSAMFHRLPNGLWGLLAWYPGAKEPKAAKAGNAVAKADDADAEAFKTEEPDELDASGEEMASSAPAKAK